MKYYLAPMEGLTGYVFRRAYHNHFHNIDKYFTPFIVNKKMSNKEIRDIHPDNNKGMEVVPQIMSNRVDDFLSVTKELTTYGYDTVNLNLGCPSGTVTAKRRGAGFLAVPDQLEEFLAEIYEKSTVKISIKTRIGMKDEGEWERILQIYEKFPIEELIIHPRLQADFYRGGVRMDTYQKAVETINVPLCYNGDIDSVEKYEEFCKAFPQTERIMIGRGMIKNPGLIQEIKGEPGMTKEILRAFYEELFEGYQEVLCGDKQMLFKMKEIWSYLGQNFTDSEKYMKKIRKANRLSEYEVIVQALFREQELLTK